MVAESKVDITHLEGTAPANDLIHVDARPHGVCLEKASRVTKHEGIQFIISSLEAQGPLHQENISPADRGCVHHHRASRHDAAQDRELVAQLVAEVQDRPVCERKGSRDHELIPKRDLGKYLDGGAGDIEGPFDRRAGEQGQSSPREIQGLNSGAAPDVESADLGGRVELNAVGTIRRDASDIGRIGNPVAPVRRIGPGEAITGAGPECGGGLHGMQDHGSVGIGYLQFHAPVRDGGIEAREGARAGTRLVHYERVAHGWLEAVDQDGVDRPVQGGRSRRNESIEGGGIGPADLDRQDPTRSLHVGARVAQEASRGARIHRSAGVGDGTNYRSCPFQRAPLNVQAAVDGQSASAADPDLAGASQ